MRKKVMMNGVGTAAFLFDWDQEGQVFVKDWYVLSEDGNIYGKDGQRGE